MADKYIQEINSCQNRETIQHVDIALFARLFSKIAGDDQCHCLTIFDTNFTPIITSDEASVEQVTVEIGKRMLSPVDLVFSDCLDLGLTGKLVALPLENIENACTGILAALIPNNYSPEHEQKLREGLNDIAEAITQVCRKEFELNNMTEEVTVRYEELNIFYDFGKIIKSNLRGEKLYKSLLELCVERLEVDLAVFIHPDQNSTTHITNPDKLFNELDLLLTRMRSEIFRFVDSSRVPLIINHRDDLRRQYLWTGMPYKFLATPVIFQKKMNAMIVILRDDTGKDFSNSDRMLLDVICEQVGNLIHNEEMYDALSAFTEQMASALIEAVDAKDPYTRGHSDRVNAYAMQLGKANNLSDTELEILYWASLLHDLGKIAVPDMVLSKLGKLDEDEYTLMKIHPERGYYILKDVEQLKKSLPGMRHHHERFDGGGYPHGLAGNDIPLHARIIAIADTYDAITTSRSYRPARTHDQAMAIINEVAGTQLDPELTSLWNELSITSPEFHHKKLTFHPKQ